MPLREVVTPQEQRAGALEPGKLARLLGRWNEDGVVVLENVLPHAVLDTIAPQLDLAAAHYVASDKGHERGPQGGFVRDSGRAGLQICSGLPRQSPWVFHELVSNPILEQIAQSILGAEVFIRYYNCNSSCPGSGAQMIHQDTTGHAWGSRAEAAAVGEAYPHRTTRIFVNFGVDAMTPQNGSTQIWPGTHMLDEESEPMPVATGWYHEAEPGTARSTWTKGRFQDNPEFAARVDRQRRARAPIQLIVPKGAVVVRDNRCWHAGRPNTTAHPRHMFGLGYSTTRDTSESQRFTGDQNGKPKLMFAANAQQAFRTEISRRMVGFVESGPVDHFGNTPDETSPSPGGRATFWLPEGKVPVRGKAEERWVLEVAAGKSLQRGGGRATATAAL
jgi:ectoine hydroxylase-related dioxygenase (phytanoyl-CoA dioxygenase family)